MAILISGSVAYDSVCSYGGRFDEMLLPDELSHLNLTFLAWNAISAAAPAISPGQ